MWCKFEKIKWWQCRSRQYFSVTMTLTTGAVKYHEKVILMREMMQGWIEKNHTGLVSYCEELANNTWRIEAVQISN